MRMIDRKIALRLKIEFPEPPQADRSVGQISEIVSSPCAKIFRLHISENQNYNYAVSRPSEGRIAIVTTRWARDAMDAAVQRRMVLLRTAKSCGPGAAMLALKSVRERFRRRR